jgi:hypothetical protein
MATGQGKKSKQDNNWSFLKEECGVLAKET